MIGTSDGQQHEDEFSYLSALHGGTPSTMPVGATGKPVGEFKSSLGTQVAPVIDRTKDVPLAASALHKDGEMYGIAIDKDAPHKPEYDQYIYKHEADEFAYMKDLIKNGMSPTEAYPKAHDHITPMESARVQADLGEKGLEDYKQYWRDVASVSTAKETADRHPDAHTTTYGLDEHELGRSFRKEAIFRGLKGAGITKSDAEFQPLNPMTPGYSNPGGHAQTGERWFRGADTKWRQEVPDAGSKVNTSVNYITNIGKDRGMPAMLGEVLNHPSLYKSYPDLQTLPVKPLPSSYKGATSAGYAHLEDAIYISPHLPEAELRGALLHEIQHAIQKREGFAYGSSKTSLLKKGLSEDEAYSQYARSAGEVEARNVERRKDYSPEARKIFKPEGTEDIPRDRQTLHFAE